VRSKPLLKKKTTNYSSPVAQALKAKAAVASARFQPPRSLPGFRDLGLPRVLLQAIKTKFSVETPIGVQMDAIDWILSGKSAVLAEQTGSGKTLAFVLPILSNLYYEIKEKDAELQAISMRKPKSPSVLVLAPTKELAAQIHDVFYQVIEGAGLRHRIHTLFVGGGLNKRHQSDVLGLAPDIVVSTPGRFSELLLKKKVSFSCLKTVVFDEADALFETLTFKSETFRTFDEEMQPILQELDRIPKLQRIFVSATMPGTLIQQFVSKHKCRLIQGKNFNKPQARVSLKLLFAKGKDKHNLMLDVLARNTTLLSKMITASPQFRDLTDTLVFCNTTKSTLALSHFLRENHVEHNLVHGDVQSQARLELMRLMKDRSRPYRVTITTDLIARGMDFVTVGHVILFDFPKSYKNFIHRVGRTGRGNLPGHVTALLTNREGKAAKEYMVLGIV